MALKSPPLVIIPRLPNKTLLDVVVAVLLLLLLALCIVAKASFRNIISSRFFIHFFDDDGV